MSTTRPRRCAAIGAACAAMVAVAVLPACSGGGDDGPSAGGSAAGGPSAGGSAAGGSAGGSAGSGPSAGGSAPSSTDVAAEPALFQVPGFSYEDPSPGDIEGLADAVAESSGVLVSFSAHTVLKDGVPIGGLLLYGIAEQYATDTAVTDQMLAGLIGGMAGSGATVTQQTIAGQKVALATDAEGSVAYGWITGGVVGMALGDNAAILEPFVDGYLEAATA